MKANRTILMAKHKNTVNESYLLIVYLRYLRAHVYTYTFYSLLALPRVYLSLDILLTAVSPG
jgi:hypothetical protein